MFRLKSAFLFFIISLFFHPDGQAQENQEIVIPGLQEPVQVLRDEWGVNHIYAKNERDLFFAQGYCAARDRLFQFEIWRRQANGTLSEILGPKELKRDMGARLFKFQGDMKKELNHYHKNGFSIIHSFVDGINTYIDEVLQDPDKLPVEFKLLNLKPSKWTPEIVISRHQGLKGNAAQELRIGRAVAIAGEAKIKDLMWFHPKTPELRLDESINSTVLSGDILELYNAFSRSVWFTKADTETAFNLDGLPTFAQPQIEGSNQWVVSGKRTESGFPHLANDPHRSITFPSLRYIVHLNAPGWNVIGGGEPAIPGISIGHNEDGAWGLTIYETDAEDIFVYDLNPEDLTQYRYKNKWVRMEIVEEKIPVKNQDSVPVQLRYSVHGPVLYIDSAQKKGFSLQAAWLKKGGAPYLASLRMNQARNWNEFRDACEYSHLPGENMMWAGKNGDIGWQVVGIAPIRTKSSGMVPVPGDGRYDWEGFLNIKKRPHTLNPSSGFMATANENVTPPEYDHWNSVGFTWADPYRGDRINRVLEQDTQRTMDAELELQADYYSIPAEQLTGLLRQIVFDSEREKKAAELLMNWNFQLDLASVPAGIYAMWERMIYREANKQFIPDTLKPYLSLQLHKIINWMDQPSLLFKEQPMEKRDTFLLKTLRLAINELERKLGKSMNDWVYGQLHYKHIELKTPLYEALTPEQQIRNRVIADARGGNSHTVNSTGGYDNQRSGATFRFIADLSDWDKAVMINSPGQSANASSPYFSNLFELWAKEGFFPAYFSKEKIMQKTRKETLLLPEQ